MWLAKSCTRAKLHESCSLRAWLEARRSSSSLRYGCCRGTCLGVTLTRGLASRALERHCTRGARLELAFRRRARSCSVPRGCFRGAHVDARLDGEGRERVPARVLPRRPVVSKYAAVMKSLHYVWASARGWSCRSEATPVRHAHNHPAHTRLTDATAVAGQCEYASARIAEWCACARAPGGRGAGGV